VKVEVSAEGIDEQAAVDALIQLIDSGFGDRDEASF
jgi:phosphotransferase system HPr-like phosphotransfer protein